MLEEARNEELLAAWLSGSQPAAQILVDRYMVRLTALVRSRLSRKLARRVDPEDVVLSAWRSFFVAAGNHRFAVPDDDDLWPLLVTMTLRKLARQAVHHRAQRRGIDAERDLDVDLDWQHIVARDPRPEEAAVIADEVEMLMATLSIIDREVLTRRLQGECRAEIAAALGCSERTIRRSLERIRAAIAGKPDDDAAPAQPRVVMMDAGNPARLIPQRLSTEPAPTVTYRDLVLHELVGEGGFGKVYRSTWMPTGTTVAVKYLKKRFWKDWRATDAFLHEVTAVRALSHPNIIRHHGWGRSPRGAVFIVMEWILGTNAEIWARTLPSTEFVPRILECGVAVASAIACACEAGIIHGDLTPRNVLRANDGRFILTDFGFAHWFQSSGRPQLGGTAGFLAPEQISDAFGPLSPRTDVYGFGGLLYALCTGSPPMAGRDIPETLARVLSSKPPVPIKSLVTDLPVELDRLIQGCLSKEPHERPATVHQVRTALEAIWKQ